MCARVRVCFEPIFPATGVKQIILITSPPNCLLIVFTEDLCGMLRDHHAQTPTRPNGQNHLLSSVSRREAPS